MAHTPGRIYPGSSRRVTGTFTDGDGVAVDPDTVTFKLRDPCGSETSYVYLTDGEVQKADTGSYYADIILTSPGRWFYRWEAADDSAVDIAAIEEGNLLVQDSKFYDGWSSDYPL